MGAPRFRLEIPADPSHAVTVRLFAAAAADSTEATSPLGDDLRLLLTELLANAVERGAGTEQVTIEVTPRDDGIQIDATGIGEPVSAEGPVDRWRIVEALCPELRTDGTAGGSLSATMVSQA